MSNAPNTQTGTSPELQRWNERFSGSEYVFGTAPNAFLADQAHLLRPGEKVLAVADGEGRNGVWLAEQGLDVRSFDFSPVGIGEGALLGKARGVTLSTELANAAAWRWEPARFDVVVAIFIQFAGPELREKIFEGIRRTLVPGGLLLLQGYRPEQLRYGTAARRAPRTCTRQTCCARHSRTSCSSSLRSTTVIRAKARATSAWPP